MNRNQIILKNKIILTRMILFFIVFSIGCGSNNQPYKIKTDNFDKSSGVISIQLDSQKIRDLALLGKVWGFLKYYHPSIAKGTYNWDFEFFKILPQILSSRNSNESNKILFEWIESFGSIVKGIPIKIDSSTIKCYPDLGWITETSELGDSLSQKLVEISQAKRTGENYYVFLAPGIGNAVFQHEDAYKQLHFPDAGYRLLSLFRYWNMIQYYFPYKYLIEEDWKVILLQFIPRFVNANDELDYEKEVYSLTARICDSHAQGLETNDNVWKNSIGKYVGIAKVSFIENKAVVTGFYSSAEEKTSEINKGDIILEINGEKIEDIIISKLPNVHASNYPTALRNIAQGLLLSKDSFLNITLQRGNLIKTIIFPCHSISDTTYFYSEIKRDTCFKYVSPDISYIYPGTIKNEYLDSIMPGF